MNIIPLKYTHRKHLIISCSNNNAADAQICVAGEVKAAITLGYPK